jgi:hypothetical protein
MQASFAEELGTNVNEEMAFIQTFLLASITSSSRCHTEE